MICPHCQATVLSTSQPVGATQRKVPVLVPDHNSASGQRVEWLSIEVDSDLAKILDSAELPAAFAATPALLEAEAHKRYPQNGGTHRRAFIEGAQWAATPMVGREALSFGYTNWRGETSHRRVSPISLRYGVSEYHKRAGWLMLALDLDKNEQREFAMRDMVLVEPANEIALAAQPAASPSRGIEGPMSTSFDEVTCEKPGDGCEWPECEC